MCPITWQTIAELQSKLRLAESRVTTAESAAESLRGDAAGRNTALSAVTDRLDASSQALAAANVQLAEQAGTLEQRSARIEALTAELELAVEARVKAESRAEEATSLASGLEGQVAALRREMESQASTMNHALGREAQLLKARTATIIKVPHCWPILVCHLSPAPTAM